MFRGSGFLVSQGVSGISAFVPRAPTEIENPSRSPKAQLEECGGLGFRGLGVWGLGFKFKG